MKLSEACRIQISKIFGLPLHARTHKVGALSIFSEHVSKLSRIMFKGFFEGVQTLQMPIGQVWTLKRFSSCMQDEQMQMLSEPLPHTYSLISRHIWQGDGSYLPNHTSWLQRNWKEKTNNCLHPSMGEGCTCPITMADLVGPSGFSACSAAWYAFSDPDTNRWKSDARKYHYWFLTL